MTGRAGINGPRVAECPQPISHQMETAGSPPPRRACPLERPQAPCPSVERSTRWACPTAGRSSRRSRRGGRPRSPCHIADYNEAVGVADLYSERAVVNPVIARVLAKVCDVGVRAAALHVRATKGVV